ncbi:MAG: serine/threonine protein kinase [Kiritimatiellae bacterium]|nr:serine/threonine protein kinase [Kiritimatiellia bacterium]
MANGLLEIGGEFGDYHVVSLLGRGGMAEVYLIRAPNTGAEFAVKILAKVPDDELREARRRFAHEAEAAARIVHPNLARVYDWGEDPDSGLCYLIMDYMCGGTLAARLATRGSFPIDEAIATTARLASALAVAHAAGVVHRDIKPENIMYNAAGMPKILDLGIAKFAGDARSGRAAAASGHAATMPELTMAGVVIGTPAYMAPEQVKDSHGVDARADVYSLGIVFYEMLSGERPNPDATVDQLLDMAMRGEEIADVRITMPEVSAKLAKVVSRMCAPRREDRAASMMEVVRLLMETDEGRRAVPAEIAAAAIAAPKPSPLPCRRAPLTVPRPRNNAAAKGKVKGGSDGVLRSCASFAAVAVVGAMLGLSGGIEIGLGMAEEKRELYGASVREANQAETAKTEVRHRVVTVTNYVFDVVTVVATNWVAARREDARHLAPPLPDEPQCKTPDKDVSAAVQEQTADKKRRPHPLAGDWRSRRHLDSAWHSLFDNRLFSLKISDIRVREADDDFYEEEHLGRYDCLRLDRAVTQPLGLDVVFPPKNTEKLYHDPQIHFALSADGDAIYHVTVTVNGKKALHELVYARNERLGWKDFDVNLGLRSSNSKDVRWPIPARTATIDIWSSQGSGTLYIHGLRLEEASVQGFQKSK